MGDVLGWLPVVLAVLVLLGWHLTFTASRIDRLHHRVESSRAGLETQLARRAAAALEIAPVLLPATGAVLSAAASEALSGAPPPDVVDLRAPARRRPAPDPTAQQVAEQARDVGTEVLVLPAPGATRPGPGAGPGVTSGAAAGSVARTGNGMAPTPDGPGAAVPAGMPAGLSEGAQNGLTRAMAVAFADPREVAVLRLDPVTADLVVALTGACVRAQMARRFHNDAVSQAQRVRHKRVVRWARLAGRAELPQMVEIDDSVPPALLA